MKITILYDNDAWNTQLQADWGFACLIEAFDKTILFDTGARGDILIDNMKKLNISPDRVDEIFISHDHWDHTGGLSHFLQLHPARVYMPSVFSGTYPAEEIIKVHDAEKLHNNIYSTGTLQNIEQSMVIKQNQELVVIAGCSHPGVDKILDAAAQFGEVTSIIGGLHGFNDFPLLKNLETICATHCTQYKNEIQRRYPSAYIQGGAGKVIEI